MVRKDNLPHFENFQIFRKINEWTEEVKPISNSINFNKLTPRNIIKHLRSKNKAIRLKSSKRGKIMHFPSKKNHLGDSRFLSRQ